MRTVTVKKADGASGGSVVLDDKLFGAKISAGLVHQAVLTEMTNRRQDTRNTKTRGEVAGGGRKPYRQKGTGRARQGSISAPHYRHGGIVFGPHPRDLSRTMPKKMRRAAIASALSIKAQDDAITVLDSLVMNEISTKAAAGLLKSIGISGKALIVIPEHNPVIYKSFRNIPGIVVRVAPGYSVRDIMDTDRVVLVKDAIEKMENAWSGNGAKEVASS
jgi:large subunit ribosomal protein L4